MNVAILITNKTVSLNDVSADDQRAIVEAYLRTKSPLGWSSIDDIIKSSKLPSEAVIHCLSNMVLHERTAKATCNKGGKFAFIKIKRGECESVCPEEFKKMYLQGKAFWIPKSKESHERHYGSNFCILYLPINKIGLKEVSRKKTSFDNSHQTWDDVLYSVMGGAGFFSENQNYRKSVQNKKNEAIHKLVNESQFKSISYEITRNFDELKKLMDEIQAIKGGK